MYLNCIDIFARMIDCIDIFARMIDIVVSKLSTHTHRLKIRSANAE